MRVGELGHALSGAAVDRDVIDRPDRRPAVVDRDRRQRQRLELPRERVNESRARLVTLNGRQEADLAEVDPEDGNARMRVAPERPQDRPVAAERDRDVDVGRDVRVGHDPVERGHLGMLARLLGVQPDHDAVGGGELHELRHRLGRLRRSRVGEDGHRPAGIHACA